MEKNDFLKDAVKHIDIKSFDSTEIIEAMKNMSFTARDTARAADIFNRMIRDDECTIILCIAGSTSAAGCKQIYVDMGQPLPTNIEAFSLENDACFGVDFYR